MNDRFIGPTLPPFKQHDTEIEQIPSINPNVSDGDDINSYGPQLPPHLQKSVRTATLMKPKSSHECDSDPDSDSVIGPLPVDSASQQALEEENYLKYKLFKEMSKSNERQNREEWMTELPPEKGSQFGLEARKFKTSYSDAKADRSSWTQVPDSACKTPTESIDKRCFETREISKRNTLMDEEVKKSKKHKREKSLLELHREKLKKSKKKSKDEKQKRRPFDRDVDLQVNRFDEAQKKTVIDKAQFLDSRFAAGKSKYL